MNDKEAQTAQKYYESAIVADLLLPVTPDLESETKPFLEAGTTWTSISITADDEAWPQTVFARLAAFRQFFRADPEKFLLVDRPDDIVRAKENGKLAVSFNFQGTEAVGRNLSLIGAYYDLGVRSMLMAYNFQNNVGTGCIEAMENDLGLSKFGRALVAEMNRVGMFVDLSHSGFRTTMDAMEVSSAPCIFSHSNVKALYDHPRNIRDEQIRSVAATGGFIGVNGVGSFIGEPSKVNPQTVFRHVDYLVQMVGARHVAFGLDYMSPALCDFVLQKLKGDLTKVGMSPPPWGYLRPQDLVQVVELMVKADYDEQAITDILGGNVLRLARQVWK